MANQNGHEGYADFYVTDTPEYPSSEVSRISAAFDAIALQKSNSIEEENGEEGEIGNRFRRSNYNRRSINLPHDYRRNSSKQSARSNTTHHTRSYEKSRSSSQSFHSQSHEDIKSSEYYPAKFSPICLSEDRSYHYSDECTDEEVARILPQRPSNKTKSRREYLLKQQAFQEAEDDSYEGDLAYEGAESKYEETYRSFSPKREKYMVLEAKVNRSYDAAKVNRSYDAAKVNRSYDADMYYHQKDSPERHRLNEAKHYRSHDIEVYPHNSTNQSQNSIDSKSHDNLSANQSHRHISASRSKSLKHRRVKADSFQKSMDDSDTQPLSLIRHIYDVGDISSLQPIKSDSQLINKFESADSVASTASNNSQAESSATHSRNGSFRRVRSFRITRKGLEKEDLVVKSSKECLKNIVLKRANNESVDKPSGQNHKVLILGSARVGKKALIQDFLMPEEYLEKLGFEEDGEKSVSILLDGEESTLEFVDLSDHEVDRFITAEQIDAYVVVYSVEDRQSFETAIDRLFEIRQEDGREVAVILVANKADLVRTRNVHENEGKSAAQTYDCKYIEVSAAIDHKIDELLVGILKQIRLMKDRKKQRQQSVDGKDSCCPIKAKHSVLEKIFGRQKKRQTKSCENLYVL